MREAKQEYWIQKAKDILEEAYPKKYRAMKKDGTLEEVNARFAALNKQKLAAEDALNKARERLSLFSANVEKYGAFEKKCKEELIRLKKELETGLLDNAFESIYDVEKLLKEVGDERLARERSDAFFTRYGSWKRSLNEWTKPALKGCPMGACTR